MDLPTTQITASADIWSLAMVISEICNGEVPYDSQECRQMSLDNFMAHLREGHRPQLSKDFAHLTWLNEMVSVWLRWCDHSLCDHFCCSVVLDSCPSFLFSWSPPGRSTRPPAALRRKCTSSLWRILARNA